MNLEDRRHHLVEVNEQGFDALSDWDKSLHKGDEQRGLWITRCLLTNQIRSYESELLDCNAPYHQITLFDATAPAPDAHLEAQYDDQQSGFEDD